MTLLPAKLYSRDQTRKLDSIASTQFGLSAATLMTRAGTAALACLRSNWPDAYHLLIVCGSGNNGGDGYEVARQATQQGLSVTLIELGKVDKMSSETLAARQAMIDADIMPISNPSELSASLPPHTDIVVDALFGTGLDRMITGHYAEAINLINALQKPVVALDMPSGLDANTGNVHGVAIKAACTISFIGLNTGLFTGEAADYTGQLHFHALNLPDAVYADVPATAMRIDLDQVSYQQRLRPRSRTSHKGSFGHSLMIGGDIGMSGAIRIAGEAAARTGSGLVSVATQPQHAALINIGCPELMCHAVENRAALTPLLHKATALAIGPGLGQSDWAKALFSAVIDGELPLVLDADALNLLAQSPLHRDNWILTPHPGEAARLLNCTTPEIQADRWQAVKQLQQRYGGVVALKGAGTLIYDGHQPIKVCGYGNPGMASGGMGDALTGIITGLLAQRFDLSTAAEMGVMLHGKAADVAARQGERGLLASDLLTPLRHLLNPTNQDPM